MRESIHRKCEGSMTAGSRDRWGHTLPARKVIMTIVALVALSDELPARAADQVVRRAVLPAQTFAAGPTSGRQLGDQPINGRTVPFIDQQPVQGFSAVLSQEDGTFWVMSDNGFGQMENSADYHLRVHKIDADFETKGGGSGNILLHGFLELHDPDNHVPFAITNHFTDRVLTGADFDIESMQRVPDGTLWFGDESGP